MSQAYEVPLRDMNFLYFELFGGKEITDLEAYQDADPETIKAVLEEAAKFIEAEILPLNLSGDLEGCTLTDGEVTTPKGFKEAYTQLAEGGWTSLSGLQQYGGMGLPYSVGFMVSEMIAAANQSFSMYPGLTHGAAAVIENYGSDEQKELYLSKFNEGSWSGTMCLTEPHCGTDLSLILTKAEPNDDGTHNLTGTKIFISSGEHDLTDNIVHLVLARLPDAPPGIKGISLFIVPKYLTDASGEITERNGIVCGSIEHKMGIHGNATCVMNMTDAKGYLIGEPHRGMQAMFVMMNSARLGTGLQGFAIGERAYQGALNYARDRLQMRSLSGAKRPELKADPIIVHADVRRMLLTIRAYTEGCRAMSYWIAQELDIAEHHPDEARRQKAEDLAALMTPVIKAFSTDKGFDSANLGIQVFGGHGYVTEHGMEQFARDARIAQIYEGTNGIQALDLVGRKLPMHDGRLLKTFFAMLDDFIAQHEDNEAYAEFILPLTKATGGLKQTSMWLATAGRENPDHVGAAAVDYLHIFGLVTVAWMWTKMAITAIEQDPDGADEFYQGKIATARFYMAKLLPHVYGHMQTAMSGSDSLMTYPDNAF